LASEVLARSHEEGLRTITGRADEFDHGIPYGLFRDLLGRVTVTTGPLRTRVDALREGLDAAAPASGAPGDAHLSLVLARAVEVFRALSAEAPAVLLVEDVHLADADSLALLALLLRLRDVPMLTILTLRPQSESGARDLERLAERLAFDGDGAVCDLAPLDRDAVGALAGATLGAEPDPRVIDAAFDRSAGNPFFARESLRALSDAGALRVEGGRAHLLADVAVDARGPNAALLDRVFGSGAQTLALAKIVAAFGRFSLRHLPLAARLVEQDEAVVTDTFDRLVREHVLMRDPDGAYEFAHAIVRDAVYGEIGPAERRRLHGAIARELAAERRAGTMLDTAELATHVAESADPGDEWAVEVLLEAARTVSATAPLVAAQHYRRAVALMPAGSPRRAATLALLARALHIGSRPLDAAAAGAEALPALAPGPQRRAAVAIVVNGLTIAGRIAEALAVVEDELAAGGDACPLAAQRVHLLLNSGRPADAAAAVDEAVAPIADAAPGDQVTAAAHLLIYAWDAGNVALAAQMRELLEGAASSGPDARRMLAHETIAFADRSPGVVASLERHLEAARELRPNPSIPSIGGLFETAEMYLCWLRGNWDAGLGIARATALDLEQRGVVIVAQAMRINECELLVLRGAVDEAAGIADGLLSPNEELVLPAEQVRAAVRRALGDADGATAILERARERSVQMETNWRRPEVLSELADLYAEAGRLEEARAIGEEVIGLAVEPCRFEWLVAAARLRAQLWENVAAGREYLALAEREQLRFERARALLLLGDLGDDPHARLTEAFREFDALGSGPWRRRAAASLRAADLPVPRPARRAGEGLTDVEQQLVRLVRDGLTNRQIAAAMHYSPKTVEVYLSRVYAKTQCASRVELIRAVDAGALELRPA
jgi:DNA-binding CsgD family transcriptional regulator